MTDTLISLISIFVGIVVVNIFGVFNKKYAFDLIGNSIAGVFGSIFFIKSFGHFGIDPVSVMKSGETDLLLFSVNLLVSALGGIIAVITIKKIKNRLEK